ncbi:hypothetical protein [Geodermatophilus dictyosporus]|uniref:hypothetical protein n=1 Tax=Geodermatophilus dictyosporus TaxID=1523247 RepID=UPI00145C2D62|nr:hypothetical protein [Geodermatophilus dictyosporus]
MDHVEVAPGRALVESGELVAGSMARSAAGLLFDGAAARVRLDDRLAAWLRRTATAADADLPAPVPRRGRCRAGAALAFAAELSVTRAAQGRSVRSDGFLARGPGDRAPADELAEAVVLAAADTTEEWRVRHLGYLLAEAAVSPDLDAAVVRRGLRLAGELTGRQLVLLAAVGRRERLPLPMAPVPQDPRGWTAWGALEDLTDLQRRGLLDPPPARPRPGGAALPRLRPADLRPTRSGVLVHRLLALDFVRDDAVTAALADLA